MILYFSATGNSEYVAKRIARETKDTTISMTDCYKKQMMTFDSDDEVIGIISPTYAWGLPNIVSDYLQNISFKYKPKYIYFVATYGTTPGQTGKFVEEILAKKGLELSAKFSVKMPDTWTPIFDLSNQEKVQQKNKEAEKEIDFIIKQIKNLETGDFMKNESPYLLAQLVHHVMYEKMRKTKHFSVEDSCVGCGMCERNCPVSAIKLSEGKPTWVKEKCVMCLSCLHHCPKFAIEYGKNTKKHGQYIHDSL